MTVLPLDNFSKKLAIAVGSKPADDRVPITDPVGFVLVGARIVDLRLNRRGLRCADDALHGLAAGIRRGPQQHGRNHCGHGQNAVSLVFIDRTRDVALGDVGDFVGKDAGDFALVFTGENQPGIHADIAAR